MDQSTGAGGSGGSDAQGGAGATTAPMAATTSSTTSGGGSTTNPCDGPADGYCDPDSGEECDCADCTDTGYCIEGACDAEDGECHYAADSCVCPDCDLDYFCGDPGDNNCTNDGTCDNYIEGCNCVDCYTDSKCTDNVAACEGGAVDDVCGATEDCTCPDCIGTLRCVPCSDNGECGFTESCLCDDCLTDPFCLDTDNCADDTICAPLYEGCDCTDCGGETQCGGGSGGTGGTGGSGGSGGT